MIWVGGIAWGAGQGREDIPSIPGWRVSSARSWEEAECVGLVLPQDHSVRESREVRRDHESLAKAVGMRARMYTRVQADPHMHTRVLIESFICVLRL